jgi:hypothetical protein
VSNQKVETFKLLKSEQKTLAATVLGGFPPKKLESFGKMKLVVKP